MPRLPTSLILQARQISPLLPIVLQGARTLDSAINELRWMKEHVQESSYSPIWTHQTKQQLVKLCQRRARSEPLQYILGSQPFGELDIKCKPGVLIPRPETEAYTAHLASIIISRLESDGGRKGFLNDTLLDRPSLRILDVCSGSGCISLLLYHLLYKQVNEFGNLQVTGLDISEDAVCLADNNLVHNIEKGYLDRRAALQVNFLKQDFFQQQLARKSLFHVIISNPPYISQQHFNTETTRSVRNWEPKLALVPQQAGSIDGWDPEDIFYAQLIKFYEDGRSKILVMEVGDEAQASRIITRAIRQGFFQKNNIEIWRDWPAEKPSEAEKQWCLEIDGWTIHATGAGQIRAVVFVRRSEAFGYSVRKMKMKQAYKPRIQRKCLAGK